MIALEFFGWFAGVVLIYAVLSRGLFLATDNVRQSLVDLGGQLVENAELPDDEKDHILGALDSAHSTLCAWLLVATAMKCVFVVPFTDEDKEPNPAPAMLRSTYESFVARWMIATVSNSLAATIIFGFLFLLTAALRVSFYRFSRSIIGTVHTRGHDHGHNHARA